MRATFVRFVDHDSACQRRDATFVLRTTLFCYVYPIVAPPVGVRGTTWSSTPLRSGRPGQLHPTLVHLVRPDAHELRETVRIVVEPLLTLTAAEREYTDRLQAGDLRPELLFPEDQGLAERLARHPALLWKARNAGRHLGGS